MTTNRNQIAAQNRSKPTYNGPRWKRPKIDDIINEQSDPALIRGPIQLPNNPILNLFTTFRVMSGSAVLTVIDGAAANILAEGSYHVLAFPFWKRITLYVANMRRRTLEIHTEHEFALTDRGSDGQTQIRRIDLDLSVTYEAIDTMIHHLALRLDQPVTMLYDAVLEAVREVAESTLYSDFKAAGRAGALIFQRIQNKNIQGQTGVRVINVRVMHLDDSESPQSPQADGNQQPRRATDKMDSAALLRLKDEVAELANREIPARLKEDQNSYYVQVGLRDKDEHRLDMYFICTDAYPQDPPMVEIELDGMGQPDASELLQDWNAEQTLVELVELAMNRYS